MPSVVSIVGRSNSGKTTLIEKLIKELVSRKYKVATVKSTFHEVSLDDMGKDSWRHIQAGSRATVLNSKDGLALYKPIKGDITLEEIGQLFGEDYDIILAEGFKQDKAPKIEVHRRESGTPLEDIENLVAIATNEPLETETRQFSLEDIKGLVDTIEENFIETRDDRLSLYINDKLITLTYFPMSVIVNILLGIAASLKGVGKVNSIKLFLKKKD